MDDASLEEFLGGNDEGEAPDGDAAETAATDAEGGDAEPPADPQAVAPATSTYAWTGDGAACEACGESVTRRFRDGEDLVCADCKEW